MLHNLQKKRNLEILYYTNIVQSHLRSRAESVDHWCESWSTARFCLTDYGEEEERSQGLAKMRLIAGDEMEAFGDVSSLVIRIYELIWM